MDERENLARYLNMISQNDTHFDKCSKNIQEVYLKKAGYIIEHLDPFIKSRERLAKIEVLEIAKQMFLDLDEMNPVDYTDSFDVINTLLEELKAGQS